MVAGCKDKRGGKEEWRLAAHLEDRPELLVPHRIQLLWALGEVPQVTKQPVPTKSRDVADPPPVPRGPAPYDHLRVLSAPTRSCKQTRNTGEAPYLREQKRGPGGGKEKAARTTRVMERGSAR